MPKLALKLQSRRETAMVNQDQIIELETRLTHLDDTVEQLNDTIIQQQKTIDKLERMISKLGQEHAELKENMAPEIFDTPPPHY